MRYLLNILTCRFLQADTYRSDENSVLSAVLVSAHRSLTTGGGGCVIRVFFFWFVLWCSLCLVHCVLFIVMLIISTLRFLMCLPWGRYSLIKLILRVFSPMCFLENKNRIQYLNLRTPIEIPHELGSERDHFWGETVLITETVNDKIKYFWRCNYYIYYCNFQLPTGRQIFPKWKSSHSFVWKFIEKYNYFESVFYSSRGCQETVHGTHKKKSKCGRVQSTAVTLFWEVVRGLLHINDDAQWINTRRQNVSELIKFTTQSCVFSFEDYKMNNRNSYI